MSDPKASQDVKTAEAGPSTTKKEEQGGAKKIPQLGALEDDDEFEVSDSYLLVYVAVSVTHGTQS